jgi:tetratricopeptide (TPR) repeat protein
MKANKLVDPQLDAQILNGRGVISFYQGKLGEARTFFTRATEIALGATQAPDLSAEDILNNLARTYHRTGQYAKAEQTYTRALKRAEIRLGTYHPNLVAPLTNLGNLYNDLGRYKESEDHFQRALIIMERSATSFDEGRLMEALHGLAKTYIRENDQSRAEPLLGRAAEIARRNLNQTLLISEIVAVLEDYSKVLRFLRSPVEADSLHAEAQRIRASAAFTVKAKFQ